MLALQAVGASGGSAPALAWARRGHIRVATMSKKTPKMPPSALAGSHSASADPTSAAGTPPTAIHDAARTSTLPFRW